MRIIIVQSTELYYHGKPIARIIYNMVRIIIVQTIVSGELGFGQHQSALSTCRSYVVINLIDWS